MARPKATTLIRVYQAVPPQPTFRGVEMGVTFFAAWKVHCKLSDLQVNSIPTLGAISYSISVYYKDILI